VRRRELPPSVHGHTGVTLASIADATPHSDRAAAPVRILTTNLTAGQKHDHGCLRPAPRLRLLRHSLGPATHQPPDHLRFLHLHHYIPALQLHAAFANHPYLIYVDADVLVLGDILAPLSQLGDGQVGLVRDMVNHAVGRRPALPGVVARWPDLRGRQYFNAGVLWTTITVLPRLRRQIDKIMSADAAHIYFNDQDALNLWALRNEGAVQPVDTAYNVFELDRFDDGGDWIRRVSNRIGPRTSPAVLHFVGPPKPWHRSCPPTEDTRVYQRYLRDVIRHIHRLGDLTATLPPPDPDPVRRRPGVPPSTVSLYSGSRGGPR
jgi:hypothetical protein